MKRAAAAMLSRMEATDEDWARLGRQVRQKRASKGLSQSAAARAAGIHRGAWSAVEKATDGKPYDTTLAAIERTLGWELGSCALILDGGDPVPVGAPIGGRPLSRVERARALIEFAKTDPTFTREPTLARILIEKAEEAIREEGERPGSTEVG